MSKQIIKILVYSACTLMTVILLGIIAPASAAWDIQPISINGNNIHIGSMALDANGNPHIFSGGYDSTNSAYYSKWNGANWENLELISSSPCVGWDSNIELDSQDNPRILFYNDCGGGPVYGINYVEKINNLWPITRLDTRFWTGKNNDIKLDANDNPHIIYTAIDGNLRYGKRIGGTWTITNIENSGFVDSCCQVAMALDSAGDPHAVYASVSTGYLRYAKWDGSNWQFRNIEYLGNTPGWHYVFPSIVIDANGNPHISYWKGAEKTIKYARWDGTNWNIQIVGNGDSGHSSMAINSQGEINIAYSNQGIKLASLTPPETVWNTESVDSIGTYSANIRLAIDRNDLPHIVYEIPDQHISKYAKKNGGNAAPIVNAGPDQSVNNGDTVTFSGSFTDSDPGDTHTISWDFGDGSASVTGTLTPTHVYANDGDYTVALTVTDSNGGVGTDTMKVTVNSIPVLDITDIMVIGDKNDAIAAEGFSGDSVIFRMDKDGNMIWHKDLPFKKIAVGSAQWIADRNLAEDSFYMVSGYVKFPENLIDGKVRLLKFDAMGNLLWDIPFSPDTFAVSANPFQGGAYVTDRYLGVYKVDTDGNVIWGPKTFGYINNVQWMAEIDVSTGGAYVSEYNNNVLIKVDKNGNELWRKNIQGAHTLNSNPIDGGIYVGAVGASGYVSDTHRLDTDGNFMWVKNNFPSPYTYARGVSSMDGSIYITGMFPHTLGKLAMDGTVLWNINRAQPYGFEWASYSVAPAIDSDHVYTGDGYWLNLGISKFKGNDGTQSGLIWHKDPGFYSYGCNYNCNRYGPQYLVYTGTPSHAPATPSTPVANPGGPYTGNEGAPIAFDASASSPGNPDRSIVSYEWNFGDGTTSTGVNPAHTYVDNGDYTATLTVTDDNVPAKTDTKTVAVTINNVPPTATLTAPASVNEGSAITLSLTNPSDPSSADTAAGLSYAFGCGTGFSEYGSVSTASCPTTDNGARTVKAKIKDKDGGENEYTASVTINNAAPTAIFAATGPIDEGSSSTLSLATPSDPATADTDTGFHYSFACDGLESSLASTYASAGTASTATCTFNDNSDHTVKSRIVDKDDGYTTYDATVSVNNVAPVITSTTGTSDPLALGSSADVTASFTDAGSLDTHTCTISWDDGTSSPGTVTESGGSGSCTGSRTYAAAGVYTVEITVIDDDASSATKKFEYVVVYDPSAGFVTGGGWINSPAGAYAADPAMTGRANFGFVSKYQKGANTPAGETEFQFKAGNLNFHSTVYEWLVVAGAKAQYKGSGTINGVGDYGFLLTATDGQVSGGGGSDKFRIKIVDKAAGGVVYDNVHGVSDDMDAANPQAIGGGSIVIHK